MKKMIIGGLATGAVAFVVAAAAPAQADGPDFNAFIADLQRAGIPYSTPSAAIDFGMQSATRCGPARVLPKCSPAYMVLVSDRKLAVRSSRFR
jgi:hypothetical protein